MGEILFEFQVCLSILSIFTSPSAENMEKFVHLGRLFLSSRPVGYSDYRKRWHDVISKHPGHSHGYKSVMAALLKANKRHILFAQMTQNAKIFKSFVVL